MLRLLLVLILLPVIAFSQNLDPRIAHHSPGTNVKSVKITTVKYGFFNKQVVDTVIRAGIKFTDTRIERNAPFADSLAIDSMEYDRKGRLQYHAQKLLFLRKMDSLTGKYRFIELRSAFQYQSDTEWVCMYTRESGEIIYTTKVNGNHALRLRPSDGSVNYEYTIDTCVIRYEGLIKEQEKPFASSKSDPFWDYMHAGYFARKAVSTTSTVDTIRYFDKLKNCIFMVIHFYDHEHRNVRTEYHSLGVRKFSLLTMKMNPIFDQSLILTQKRYGWACEVNRKFNEQGLVIEEEYKLPGEYPDRYVRSYEYGYFTGGQ